MNIGKTVLMQRTLISFCREHGYTDVKFIAVDCVSAIDKWNKSVKLSVNQQSYVIDANTGEIIDQ